MEIHIFDVEHGSCDVVMSPSGRVLMIDCGHNGTTDWRPSAWIAARRLPIANLTITNFDEDHVSDLPNLRRVADITTLTVNWHLTPDWVRRAKQTTGVGPGIRAALEMMTAHQGGVGTVIDWGGEFEVARFFHPPTLFTDENSLSVVTFVHCQGVKIVFPGDLTRAAWLAFLRDASFRAWLATTNIFVASHHGRQDGYCAEVFRHCTPAVIIISDKSVMYDTQTVDYSQHATGIRWNQTDTRHCLTSRRDGKLTITPTLAGAFWIQATG